MIKAHMDIIFLVEESFEDAGYVARATKFPIYTEANNYLELLANIRGAVNCHFGEGKKGIERILVYKLETIVEVKEAAEALEIIKDLVSQFAYPIQYKRKPALSAGGLSALGAAFDFLGWNDPHPCPENACEIKGCNEWATCGTSTPTEGYKRVCGNHFRKIQGESKDAENQ